MSISTPPAPPKTGWWANLVDSAWWAWHSTLSTIANAPRTWKLATPRERSRLALQAGTVLAFAAVVLAFRLPPYCWVGPLAVLLALLADFEEVEDHRTERERIERQHARLVEQLAEQPTGAPRVAEVTLPGTDVAYRFVYGPKGWEFSGPAVAHGPNITREESARG